MNKIIKYIIVIILVGAIFTLGLYLSEESDPAYEPTIVGYVTEVEDGIFLTVEKPHGSYFSDLDELTGRKIYFDVDQDTEIISDEDISFEDVMVGDAVKVWHEGDIAESHPEQAYARKIEVVREEFRTYESTEKGLSIDVPIEASLNYEEGRLKVTFVGPDSQMAEITDGFTFFIDTIDSDLDVYEEIFVEETEVLEPISQPQREELFGIEGYSFILEGGLGNEINYFIYQDDDVVVSISYSIMDPNEVGYIEKIEKIIRSVEVKEDLLTSKECVVSGCSGELCGEETMESTCEALPGAECLNYASCEFVTDECGWVLSQEAAECFMRVEDEQGPGVRDTRIGSLFERAEEALN